MTDLKTHYLEGVIPKLVEEFGYLNKHQIPKLEKIQINSGLGLNAQNRVFLQKATEEIRLITGQHPVLTSSRKSIDNTIYDINFNSFNLYISIFEMKINLFIF